MKIFIKKISKYLKFYFKYFYYYSELQLLLEIFYINPYLNESLYSKVILGAIYYKDMEKSITKYLEKNQYDVIKIRNYYAKT